MLSNLNADESLILRKTYTIGLLFMEIPADQIQ
jgi:hypothetical protein